ncbi:MAG: hypothetical protein AAFU77_00330 [Myxococcota bacterium]
MKHWLASLGTLTALGVFIQQHLAASADGPGPVVSTASVGPMPTATPRSGDTLSVVPVAPVPAALEKEWQKGALPAALGCPVSVRAIIAGGAPDAFAMVESGGESVSARRGEKFSTPAGQARVVSVKSNHITLTGAFGTVRCVLDTER